MGVECGILNIEAKERKEWDGLNQGIYDCFEEHIEDLERWAARVERVERSWYCLMPAQRHQHAVVIQRLPVQKIDEFLRRVELGEFEIVI